MASFPTTPQEAVDRLLTDRAFLVQSVVNDNYPTVKANFIAQLQDNPVLVNTPEKLVRELLWWDKNDTEAVDDVLRVEWLNTLGSSVLNNAFIQLQSMAATTGGGDKFVGALVTAVSALLGSGAQQNAANAAAQQAAQQAALAESQRKAQNDKFLRIAIGIVLAVAIIGFIIYIRRK